MESDILIHYVLYTTRDDIDERALMEKCSGGAFEILDSIEDGATRRGALIRKWPVSERPLPPEEALPYFSRGFSQEAADELSQCTTAVAMLGLGPFDPGHDLLKNLTQCVLKMADELDAFIFDEADSLTFTREAFYAIRVEEIEAGELSSNQFGMRAYRIDEGVRSVTMGLEKFGQTNICCPVFPEHLMGPLDSLLSLVNQTIIESPVVLESGPLTLDVESIRNVSRRNEWQAQVADGGGTGRAELNLVHMESLEGDPKRLLGPTFVSTEPGDALWREQQDLIEKVFGQARDVSPDVDMSTIEDAIEQAREDAVKILDDADQWKVPGRTLKVAVQFPQTREVMWLEIQDWNDGLADGTLLSDPMKTEGLQSGDTVQFPPVAIVDFRLSDPERVIASGGIDELVRSMQAGE